MEDSQLLDKYNFEVPQFSLEALPNKKMMSYYDIIEPLINNGAIIKHPDSFPQYLLEIHVELHTGDGTLLQTWKYEKCFLTDYWVKTYLDDKGMFTNPMSIEIRDHSRFACSNFDFIVNDIEDKHAKN